MTAVKEKGSCGIYREHFGVRAEDTMWVSEQGPVSLTNYPKRSGTKKP